jgi:hypothetical protein
MWCPAPLPEGEIHRRKLRSDKYKPPSPRLLENYESDSSVEADEDTDTEAGVDPATGAAKLLTVKIRQPSHEFTFGVGMSFIPYPLVLMRTMCGSRTGGWSLPCVMSD